MALTGSMWLLQGLGGCYRVCMAVTGSPCMLWGLCRALFCENRLAWILRDRLTQRCDHGINNESIQGGPPKKMEQLIFFFRTLL